MSVTKSIMSHWTGHMGRQKVKNLERQTFGAGTERGNLLNICERLENVFIKTNWHSCL